MSNPFCDLPYYWWAFYKLDEGYMHYPAPDHNESLSTILLLPRGPRKPGPYCVPED